ncbi:HK97 family phage portal protein [Variovorax sp. OAS795]
MAMNLLAPLTRAMAAIRVRLADPQRAGKSSFFGRTAAGVPVTHELAEQVAAVWACMDVIASALSSSDWNVYAGTRGENKKRALPDDSLQFIMNTRFNPEMTAQAGKRAVALGAVGFGTGYAEIETDLAGRIIRLWPIAPNRVEPRRDMETGRLFYRVMQEWGGGWVDMEPDELFIMRGAGLLGFAGDDTIGRAIQTIATAIALDQYAAGFFGNGAQLGTVFTYKGKLDDAHFARVKEQLDQRHTGVKNAFRSGFFEGAGEWDVKTMGVDAEKAQLIEAKHLSVEEICRWFRVPPHKIAHLLRATNNNIEHQGLEFSRDTLRPWVKEIEQEADYKLIPYRGPRKFVEIDVDWAEQGDYKSRAEAYAVLAGTGAFSPNMILRKLGENTLGAEGDIHFVNGAAIPLDRIGDAYDQAQATTPPNPAPPATDDTAQAWLASVYARIQRRFDNRSRADSVAGALSDAKTYGPEQVGELAAVLGGRLQAAQEMALRMVNSPLLPEDAAALVFEKETA